MIFDESTTIKELAFRSILNVREKNKAMGPVRSFNIPTINFNTISYEEMIFWNEADRFEPPYVAQSFFHK